MLWFPISLICAFTLSTADAFTKYFFSDLKLEEVVLLRLLTSLPFLVFPLLFIKWPHLGRDFWVTLAVLLPLEIVAFFLYMEAIRISPLSLTIPFLAFTPLFMVITGFFVLGETLSFWGVLGIFLVVVGAYVIHFERDCSFWQPFKNIMREKGSLLMLVVSLIYSVTSVLGKRCVLLSDPVFFGLFYYPFVSVVGSIFILLKSKDFRWRRIFSFKSFLVGFFQSVSILTHMIAISLVEAAYMIAVKRTSLLFSVLYGKILLGEHHFLSRFIGSLLMFVGCILIYLFG